MLTSHLFKKLIPQIEKLKQESSMLEDSSIEEDSIAFQARTKAFDEVLKLLRLEEEKSNNYLKYQDGKWFYIDERDYLTGPFDTKQQAEVAMNEYVTNFLG